MEGEKKVRVLFTRSLLEGHDRGIKVVVKRCMQSGIEAIYTVFNSIEEVPKTIIQEDVDIVGLSISSGNHLIICSRLMESLRKNLIDIPVIVGGVISSADVLKLKHMGIKEIFGPGSSPDEVVDFILKVVGSRE